jgi:predicted Zn-dependent protease
MDARYADGRAAIMHRARVEIGAGVLGFETAGGRHAWAYNELQRADDHNGEIILKRVPDTGERLVLGLQAEAALKAAAPALFTPRAHGVESPALVGWLAGSALSIAAAFLIGVPLAAQPIARIMPPHYQQQIGVIARAQMEGMTEYCEGSEYADGVLTDLAFRLLRTSEAANQDLRSTIEVSIVTASFPNAFALPDNSIIVTSELITAAEHPDELAGVIAHEVAHLEHRHVMANVIRNIGAGVFFDIIFGGAGIGQAVAVASVNLAALRYNRADEADADAAALNYLDGAGIDPGALGRFFDRIAQLQPGAENIPTLLSSHPATAARAAAARARARSDRAPALSDADWQAVRSACGGQPAPEPGAVPAKPSSTPPPKPKPL